MRRQRSRSRSAVGRLLACALLCSSAAWAAAAAGDNASEERASARMQELAEPHQAQAQRRAIEELRHHNELQTVQLQQQALQQRWLWTLLGAVVLALIGTGYFLQRLRRSSEAIRQLNASLEQRVQTSTAELRLRSSYLRALIDTLPLRVWMKDTEGRYLAVNQATADAAGCTVAQMEGRLDRDLWPPAVADIARADDALVLQARRPISREAEWPLQGGWWEVHKAPVLDHDGRVLGLVGSAHDISVRKAAEAAREAALAEARRLAQQRSDFLAQMSHELRTPLNGILGFAQILQRDKPLTERQVRGLAIIQQSGQHLLALINDILDLARIDAARLDLQPSEVDLRGLLSVVGDIVRVKAEEKFVFFARHLDERLPRTVRVDEKRLRQVLLNLLSNAVKFTDKGEVSLTVGMLPGPAGADSARLRFEVRDSGVGMDEQQLARLFQPFEQVGDAGRREGGTGLGLAISRELVRLMGGDIQVSSEPGRGSRFWFEVELPVVPEPGADARAQGLPVGYEGPYRRILVVDDVAQNRAVLAEGLAQLGFEVHEAADGAAAVALATRLRPDLVIMDLSMPVMDGLEATRRLHALPSLAGVPVIAASGSASRESEEASRHAGAAAFLVKPIHQETLLDTIGRLLGLRWRRDEPPAAEDSAWPEDEALPPLPPEDVEELVRLVRMGNMRRICEHADRLEQRDPRHARLSARLRSLAQGCQTKGLRQLVERLRPAATTPAG